MDVMLFTRDDPTYMPRYLEPVLAAHADRIAEIVLAPMRKGLLDEVRERYAMLGPRAFLRYGLKYANGNVLDLAPASVVYPVTGQYYSVRTLAERFDVPLREQPDVNDDDFVEHVRRREPDLLLSIACGQKLGEDLLRIPTHGAVNVHGSLLPKYRGLATSFWVLYHGESESGVTAHYMTPEFDAGEILIQRRYEIEPDDTMHDVYLKLIDVGADVACDVVDGIADGTVETRPNPTEEGSYYSMPTAADREEFLRRGNEFI